MNRFVCISYNFLEELLKSVIPDCSCTEGLSLLVGSFGMKYQPPSVGVHGNPSFEQLPHGHIHLPLESKYIFRQGP